MAGVRAEGVHRYLSIMEDLIERLISSFMKFYVFKGHRHRLGGLLEALILRLVLLR